MTAAAHPTESTTSSATAILATSAACKTEGARTQILHGVSFLTTEDARGHIRWFRPEELVVYRALGQRSCTFVFRTAPPRSEGTRIAGVSRPVRLLLQTVTPRQDLLLESLLRRLVRDKRDPSALPDLFYLRLQGVLARRSPREATVRALLAHHDDSCR